jgi:hypothetical protein
MYDISSGVSLILEQSHSLIFAALQITGCIQRWQVVLFKKFNFIFVSSSVVETNASSRLR